MTTSQGQSVSRCDALADDVLQKIYDREALIDRLEKLHRNQSANHPPQQQRVQRLLYGIHNASLAVVDAIAGWNLGKQDEWYHKKNIEAHSSSLVKDLQPMCGAHACEARNDILGSVVRVPPPLNVFFWNGQNYLEKMLSDLDFVGNIVEAISFLGPATSFHRNPFLLALDADELVGPIPSNTSVAVWKDVNMPRVRRAAFVILLDEHHRKESNLRGANTTVELTRKSLFRPPIFDSRDLQVYSSMLDPPAVIAITICCSHLVLGSVGADITEKLIYLTKSIVVKVFRQPSNELIFNAQTYNPLQYPDVNTMNMARLIYPFVMHSSMNPELFDSGISDDMVCMVTWLRALVSRLVNEDDISSNAFTGADRIFRDLEAASGKGDSKDFAVEREEKKVLSLSDDSNKENECSKNVSVQTEDMSPSKQKPVPSESMIRTILGDEKVPKILIPYPVAITVNLKEGSNVVAVNGDTKDAQILNAGDVVRICDAHESSNWRIATPPILQNDGGITFHLDLAYDHSRIVAQRAKTTYDILNRLCYPYKKDADGTPTHKPADLLYTIEGHTRHAASDERESIHSPLHIKGARVWKLIPEEDDKRTLWRREYDCGNIPWENNYLKCNRTHFRVRASLETVEQSCFDSPYPLSRCIHQQRVCFFESVPLSRVIDEAFHTVCRWHPQGSLIDNVKWAKLSRKMKFLSNVKNAKHEIDMAFVRHNQDRKLDIARFHAIFEDIASIQYPSLSKEEALSRVVWASIVMLPDVNGMMWKEAKRMAIDVEVKRVCAQTRIAARVRRNIQRALYLKAKHSATFISKHVRQFLARTFVSKILQAMRDDEAYQRRCRCAKFIQTAWRRYFWRVRFIMHQERRIKEKRQKIAAIRAELQAKRERERASIVFRDVVRMDSTIATVTISFRDDIENSMLMRVYVPATKETFSFNIEECAIRECLEKALSSEGRLSWDEMLKESALKVLTQRLMLRVVRGRPIFLFSRRNIVEKGILVDKRVVRAEDEIFILSTFRSPHDFVFYTYQPSTRLQMKTKLSMPKLREWLTETQQKQQHGKYNANTNLLDPKRQLELVEWLVKRIVIRKNPRGSDMQLLLQFEAEAERVIRLVTKVQSQWRRLKSLRSAKAKTVNHYEKIFVREENTFAYRNVVTDDRQWEKPKLLGDEELRDPVDEWREEETVDPVTGEKQKYYVNHGTGQSSWLSEEDAARLVQRRYRSKHESDILGRKIQFSDIVKAMKFIHGARSKYEQDPHKLSNIVNFALLTHCLDLDFDRAKPMYEMALEQSPNHPLISRAYGIFLLASRQTPVATTFQTACRLFREASAVDPSQSKFQSASEIYFRWAVLVGSKNPLALLNFALLHQCIHRKYDHAEKIYRAALALDPTNPLVAENYRLFCEQRYPGGEYLGTGPPYSVVRHSQVVEERPEWAEWSKMIDQNCPKKGVETFYFNKLTKETAFEEPDWALVWETRMKRSKCVSRKVSTWTEYFDERLRVNFFFDCYTGKYTCVRPT